MVHKRNDWIVRLILIITLFLTRGYLDTATGNGFLRNDFIRESILCSVPLKADINSVAVCTTEMLCVYSSIEQQTVELDPLLYLSCSSHHFLFVGNSFRRLETIQSLCQTSDTWVTDYVHQSDGKK